MKIAIVALTDFDKPSSTVRRVHMLGKGLVSSGHDVHIIIPQRFNQEGLFQQVDGLSIHWGVQTDTRTWSHISARIKARLATLAIINELATTGLDWLILYNLGLEAVPLIWIARWHKVHVAAEYCDVRVIPQKSSIEDICRLLWQKSADMLVPRLTDLNIAISQFLQYWLKKSAPHTPTLVIPPLVDNDLFHVQPTRVENFRRQWGLQDTHVIAYLGSYWDVEGVAVLLEAASQLVKWGEDFKLLICGAVLPGRDCDNVAHIVNELNLNKYVVTTGWLNTDDVIAAMSVSDILVVPKRENVANQAGVPTKLAEYCAMGRAIVATCVGDITLYLEDSKNALLCPSDNPQALASCLQRLLGEPGLRHRLGEQARQTALKSFDYQAAGRAIDGAMAQSNKVLFSIS